uniref:Succinate dehydrogenase subunit 4 n=1 Tax=Symphyocladiella dendroidea TaxID=2506487 RepID=UPI0022FD97B6|nr:Succinate dehydrogenase subunit 4 [Symphyocladiella dendroidea]WAX04033.1 Succinate dehydrogenase subunit 4 [Symphyocladiella dendroidea]
MFIWFFRYSFLILFLFSLIFDFEFFLLFFNFIFIHFFYGLVVILKDYIHQIEIKFFLNFLVRLLFFFILNICIELWF